MKPGLQLKLSTQLTMTPQLQQAIRLLQLSTLELQQEITHALEANPLLEVAEESGLNSLNTLPEHPSIFNLVNPGKNKADAWDYFEQIAHNRAAEETLREHLLWQMRF